jgi:hypothetical protein
MELFYIIVTVIAIILLILILTIIGIAMRYQDKNTVFPPVSNDCPDFWTIAADGKSCSIPSDGKKNVGTLYNPLAAPNDNRNIKIKSVTKDDSYTYTFPTYTPATNGNVTAAASTINFKDDTWSSQGQTAICAKKKWAVNWGITWDGVTNYNSC